MFALSLGLSRVDEHWRLSCYGHRGMNATIGVDRQTFAHRCAMQAEVFYHLVLVASADIVPEDTRGYIANVELRTTTRKPHHKEKEVRHEKELHDEPS